MEGFIFYASFKEAIDLLSDAEQLEVYRGICNYGLHGEYPEFSTNAAQVIFLMAKPQIDANAKRRTDGSRGGRKKKPLVSNEKTTGFEVENHWFQNEKPLVSELKTTGFESENHWFPNEKPKVKEKVKVKEKEAAGASLSVPVNEKLEEWIQYKEEIGEPYKPSGLKALTTQLSKKEAELGPAAVIESINTSMANGWKGLFWNKQKPNKFADGIVRADYSDLKEEDLIAN